MRHVVWPGINFSWQAQYFTQVEWKNHKTHWYEVPSAALNFPFLTEVSQKCFVFDVVKFKTEEVRRIAAGLDVVRLKNKRSVTELVCFTDRQTTFLSGIKPYFSVTRHWHGRPTPYRRKLIGQKLESLAPGFGWNSSQDSSFEDWMARSHARRLWLNSQPKLKLWRLDGKVTRSRLWLNVLRKLKHHVSTVSHPRVCLLLRQRHPNVYSQQFDLENVSCMMIKIHRIPKTKVYCINCQKGFQLKHLFSQTWSKGFVKKQNEAHEPECSHVC